MLAKKLLAVAVLPEPPPPLSITSPPALGSTNNESCTSVTAQSIATAENGTPPYSYEWSKISGDGSISSGELTNSMTAIAIVCAGETKTGVYRCTVTDDNLDTATVDVTYSWANTFGIA